MGRRHPSMKYLLVGALWHARRVACSCPGRAGCRRESMQAAESPGGVCVPAARVCVPADGPAVSAEGTADSRRLIALFTSM